MPIHAYTCLHMHTHAYTCIHMHTHAYTCLYMHTHAYTCLYMHTHAYTCIHMPIHAYTCLYMHTHAYSCVRFLACCTLQPLTHVGTGLTWIVMTNDTWDSVVSMLISCEWLYCTECEQDWTPWNHCTVHTHTHTCTLYNVPISEDCHQRARKRPSSIRKRWSDFSRK